MTDDALNELTVIISGQVKPYTSKSRTFVYGVPAAIRDAGYISLNEANALADERVETMRAAAEKVSRTAMLLHNMPAPETGPFTLQQKSADEARQQIADKIAALPTRTATL